MFSMTSPDTLPASHKASVWSELLHIACFPSLNDPAKTLQLSQARPVLARIPPQEGRKTPHTILVGTLSVRNDRPRVVP